MKTTIKKECEMKKIIKNNQKMKQEKKLINLIDETIIAKLENAYHEYAVTNSKLDGNVYISSCSFGKKNQINTVLVHRRQGITMPYWLSVTEDLVASAKAVAKEEGNDRAFIAAVNEELEWCVLLPLWREARIDNRINGDMVVKSGYIESEDEFGEKIYTWCIKGLAHCDMRDDE